MCGFVSFLALVMQSMLIDDTGPHAYLKPTCVGLGRALGKSRELADVSRADWVQTALHNSQLDLVKKLGVAFDLISYAFDKELAELSHVWLSQYQPNNQVTVLGEAVRQVWCHQLSDFVCCRSGKLRLT